MKKIIKKQSLFLIVSILLLSPFVIFAASVIENPLTYGTFNELIEHILGFIFTLAIVLVPLIVVYAGFLFMTSEGDPIKVGNAKKLLTYAVVGLIIVLLSKAIISIIHGVLS